MVDTSTRTLELDEFAHESSAAARMRPKDREASGDAVGPADASTHPIDRERAGADANPGYLSDEEIERAMERDNFMDPEQAKTYGLIDEVANERPNALENKDKPEAK